MSSEADDDVEVDCTTGATLLLFFTQQHGVGGIALADYRQSFAVGRPMEIDDVLGSEMRELMAGRMIGPDHPDTLKAVALAGSTAAAHSPVPSRPE